MMPRKFGRKTFPPNHNASDFKCFGPPATQDGQFDNCMIADLGCFTQDGKDTNKSYHAAVVQSKKTGTWYAYFEWGRTGNNPDFLFIECNNKKEAQSVMAKQLHSKNDKRGEWITVAGHATLRAKKGKDCYLVRPIARRTTGLPDAQKLVYNDRIHKEKHTTKKKITSRWDPKTLELAYDLMGATIDFTRKSFAGDYIPTQTAIDEARDYLTEAMRRVKILGNDIKTQINDKELKELTRLIYSRIPKIKPIGASPDSWILSSDNISSWRQDLDAFESALACLSTDDEIDDPFDGFDLEMKWCDPKTREYEFISHWMPTASANKHRYVGKMVIKNIWSLRQPSLISKFQNTLKRIGKQKKSERIVPKFQPQNREDLNVKDRNQFKDANVALLFHGTRSVNVSGILRTGLRLPKQLIGVVITGAMFGPGIYWADDWRKSDGYTSRKGTFWAKGKGGIQNRGAFMFVGNVALGNPYIASSSMGYTKPPKGYHSVVGLAGKSGVENNEWIVYDSTQTNLAYLIEYNTTR